MGTQYSIKTNGDSDPLLTVTAEQLAELVGGTETTLHSHAGGSGDMQASTYDPQTVQGDAFDCDNHTDGVTNKVFSATEQTKLTGIATGADVTADNTCDTPGGAGTDTTAIHDDTTGEINAVAEKETPASADVLLIEDSAASYAKKKVQITNLPAGTPGADSINDTHIDWGAGANQVDADDVPESATRKWAGETGATQDQTGAEIKSAYEGEADTNAYTDAEKSKLGGIDAGADVTGDNTPQAHETTHQSGGSDVLYVPRTYVWFLKGAVSAGTEQGATFRIKRATTVEDVELHVKTAPSGGVCGVDINEAGTTLFSTEPHIDDGQTTEDDNHAFSDTSLAAGNELTMDITAANGAEDLTVLLHCYEAVI